MEAGIIKKSIACTVVLSGILGLIVSSPEASAESYRVAVAWEDSNRMGVLRAMNAGPPWDFQTLPLTIDAEMILRYAFGRLYVVSPAGGTITVIDPNTWSYAGVYSVGAGSKPQDILVVSPALAYVSRQNSTHLLRLNLETGETNEVVDLSRFADADGIPDMGTMASYNGRLFIQIRRFGQYGIFVPPAYIAVVDIATEQLIQGIRLKGTFPVGKMQVVPQTSQLFVRATGIPYDKGGIERIDLKTLRSLGLVLPETGGISLGTDYGAFVMVSPTSGYFVTTTDIVLSTHLFFFTVDGGVDTELGELYHSLDHFAEILLGNPKSQTFFYPDGGYNPAGVHVFDSLTGERLTAEPTATTGPPRDMVLLFDCDRKGDFDHNCIIDFRDFAYLSSVWLTDPNDAVWNPECDISSPADNIINFADLKVFVDNWLADYL
jgi:hypothetical protein